MAGSYGKTFATLLTWFIKIGIIFALIVFLPGLPPDLDYEANVLHPLSFQGPLSINNKLNNAERLFENKVKGPEDFDIYNNELYTTCHGGFVYKITQNKLEPVLITGKKCDGFHEEHICGRPLGLKFDKSGLLYVADAYYGLLKSNLTTGKIETLVSMEQEIDGVRPMIPNSLVISDNFIYWTDSSTTHNLFDGIYTFLGNGRGRVLKHSISENKNEVLIKNLHFANGILISKDGNFLIIAETFKARLLRYYIRGLYKGTMDVFVDNLPGYPDNIHKFDENNFIVSLVLPIDEPFKTLLSYPLLSKFLARSLALIESTFKIFNYFLPTSTVDRIIHWIGHFEMMHTIKPNVNPHVISVIIDYNGKITGSLHANDFNVLSVSGLVKFKNYYYLGSPFNPYLARVKIS